MRRRGQRCQDRGRHGRFREHGDDLDKWGPGWERRGMGRWDRDFQDKDVGKDVQRHRRSARNKWYQDHHQKGMQDREQDESDFEWDW
jgi:hypothetical protein